jgi:hypothetical protein
MPKVIVLPGSGFRAVEDMFRSESWEITHDIDEADLVQFVGGSDVSPHLYHQHPHRSTISSPERDEREKAIFIKCVDNGIPMAGICRGGQFLNVMNGGSLYQDVDNHCFGNHKAWIKDGVLPVIITSTHHQMIDPNYSTEVVVLMTAAESTRKWQMSDIRSSIKSESCMYPEKKIPRDIEALYYPGTRSLCYQPHPEFGSGVVGDTKEIYFIFLERYLFGGIERIEQQA